MDLAVSTPDPAGAAPEPSTPAGTVAYGYQSSTDSPAPTSVRAAPAASAGLTPRHFRFADGASPIRDATAPGGGGAASPEPERRWYGDGYYTRREFEAGRIHHPCGPRDATSASVEPASSAR